MFAIIPATRSSTTMPAPPGIFRSKYRMGNGLKMSSNLKRTNPITTVKKLNGSPARVTSIPAISSMTIQPGSFLLISFSLESASQIANRMKAMMITAPPPEEQIDNR